MDEENKREKSNLWAEDEVKITEVESDTAVDITLGGYCE